MIQKLTRLLEIYSIKITSWLLFFKKEKQFGLHGFSLKKITYYKKGFFSSHPIQYDFKKYNYSDYISDIENTKLAYINHPYGRLLRNKLIFSNFFNSYFKTPECYCIVNKGIFEPVNYSIYIDSFSKFLDLAKQKKLILKPLLGTAGIGVTLIEFHKDNSYFVNKKLLLIEQIRILLESINDYLVEEFIEQGDFTKKFFPQTTNTIRLTTFAYPDFSSSFIPYGFIRFGRVKTVPVDNISLGGLFSIIDLNTGTLSEAYEETKDRKVIRHIHHPDSGVLIKGTQIPHWDKLKNFFVQLGGVIKPFIKIVGWDIVLTNDSFIVIEGNNGPDIYFQGLDYPLAKNEDVVKFLKGYKIRK